MPAATLALGQSSYALLEALTESGVRDKSVAATRRGTGANYVTDIRSTLTDGLLSDLGIGTGTSGQALSNVNVYSKSTGLQADLGAGSDTLNLFADANAARIELDDRGNDGGNEGTIPFGGGNDLLNAQRSLTNSEIFAGSGNDTIRIAGQVDGSLFILGDGNDLLSVGGASQNFVVDAGKGNDLLQFRGLATDAIIQGGEGNDTVQFFSGLTGTSPRLDELTGPTASVDLGAGNDSLLIGGGGQYSNLELNTGTGRDTLTLNGDFIDTGIVLGGDTLGDSLNFASGFFTNSWITSSNASGDTLVFGAATNIFNTNADTGIFLGSGADSIVFGGGGRVEATVKTGQGSDTVVFGANSAVNGTNLNLGADTDSDKVYFNMSFDEVKTNFATGMRITGQTTADTLYIGYGDYKAYAWHQDGNYWFGSGDSNDTIKFVG